MDYSETIHFDKPMTSDEVQALYTKTRYPGDPRLFFEEITPTAWQVTLRKAHHLGVSEDDFRDLLRLRLSCRIG